MLSKVEQITEYALSEDGLTITGYYEIEPRQFQYFRLTGEQAREIHRARVRWENKAIKN